MKLRNLLHTACNILLTALLTGSTLGCVISAFDLTVDGAVLLRLVGLFSLLAGLCCALPGSVWVAALPPLMLAAPQLWKLGLEAHTEAFLWKLSLAYEQAYSLGFIIWWTGSDHTGLPTTLFFGTLALILIFFISLGLARRRTWPAVVLTLPLLLMCVAVPQPALNAWFFFLALLCLGSLCLSASVRRFSATDAPVMTATSTAAVAAALVLLFAVLPQDTYVPKGEGISLDALISGIVQWFDPQSNTPPGPGGHTMPDKMQLDQAGPREDDPTVVFTVRSNYNGYIYLRGRSYETYTGTAWEADPTLKSSLVMDDSHKANLSTYQLSLNYAESMQYQDVLFIPWHPGNRVLTGGFVENTTIRPTFTFNFHVPKPNWDAVALQPQARYTAAQVQNHMRDYGYGPEDYLPLPKSTENQAKAILQELGISSNSSMLDITKAVSLYVSRSAYYSKNTQKMPAGERDFVLWFLNDSRTGYCVHFASAATVLLRAAGIPARYVEGYLFYSQAHTELSVPQQRAHAWVEYYVPTLGWMILEVTPDDGLPERLPDVYTEPATEPTTEPTTRPTTEPTTEHTTKPTTQPTRPTLTEPTAPSTGPAAQPTQPAPAPGGDTPPDLSWLWSVLKVLAWTTGFAAVLIGQWRLRLALLLRRLHRGDPNTQALARWKHSCRLARLRKQDPPAPLRDLAVKAKFSQHTLTDRELMQFDRYRAASIARLQKQPLFKRFVYRIILAIY